MNGQDCSLPVGEERRREGDETTGQWLQTATDEGHEGASGFHKGPGGKPDTCLLAATHRKGMLLVFTFLILANAATYTVKTV